MTNKISIITVLLGTLLILIAGCKKIEPPPSPVTDIDGNTYKTVRIGTQVWMAGNLRTTRLNDGTEIPLVTDSSTWHSLSSSGYCWYNNDEVSFKDPYGAIYNGYTINTGKLCPDGWHVPDREEFQQLREILGDTITAGGKLKESGTGHWYQPNKGADNSSGFTALPAGIRYFEGTFASYQYFTSFWSATEESPDNQWYLSLYFGDAIANMNLRSKKHGFSVRCIKDLF